MYKKGDILDIVILKDLPSKSTKQSNFQKWEGQVNMNEMNSEILKKKNCNSSRKLPLYKM